MGDVTDLVHSSAEVSREIRPQLAAVRPIVQTGLIGVPGSGLRASRWAGRSGRSPKASDGRHRQAELWERTGTSEDTVTVIDDLLIACDMYVGFKKSPSRR
jgi:hypothetical protein